MSVTYIDIVQKQNEIMLDGGSVSHVVLTDDAIQSVIDGTVYSGTQDHEHSERVKAFDVETGERNVIVTEDGSEVEL